MKIPQNYQVEIDGERATLLVNGFVKYRIFPNSRGIYEVVKHLHEDSSVTVGKYGTLHGAINFASKALCEKRLRGI